MRTLPGVQLTRASDYTSIRSSWLVTLPQEQDKAVGMAVRDLDILLPPTNEPWQALIRRDDAPQAYRHLSWHRTRREAERAVLVEYVRRQDEITAHQLLNAVANGTGDAEKRAHEVRENEGDTAHITPADGGHYSLDTRRLRENRDSLAEGLRDDLAGRTSFADSPSYIYDIAYTVRLITLELDRRERQGDHDA